MVIIPVCALGKIPLSPASASGQVRIMLRPEQLRIDPIDPSALGARGEVVRTLPCASQCRMTLTLDLPGDSALRAISLDILVPGVLAPATGSRVTVHVLGSVHAVGLGG